MADNKDLKKFRGGIRLESTSAPANADAGALYFDSDSKGLKVHDGTNFTDVGAGSSGGLDTFYSEDFRAFDETTDLTQTTSNAAISIADNINGKSLVITQAASASSGTIFYTKDGGHAVVTKQKGNTCSISFWYTFNGSDDKIKVVVKSLDSSDVETTLTSSSDLLKSTSTAKKFVTTFTVPSDSAKLQWGIDITAEDNKILKIDDVEMSQDPFVQADLGTITEWKTWDNPTWGSALTVGNAEQSWKYRRVGDTIHVQGQFKWGSTTSMSSGDVQIILPQGFKIDLSKTADSSAHFNAPASNYPDYVMLEGWASYWSEGEAGSGTSIQGELWRISTNGYSDDTLYILGKKHEGSNTQWTNAAPEAWANNDIWVFNFSFPVQGWESTNTHIVTPAKSNLTDWVTYTPDATQIGANGTNDATGRYRRVGDSMEVTFELVGHGSPQSVMAVVGLPGTTTGASSVAHTYTYTPDFNKIISQGTILGHWWISQEGDADLIPRGTESHTGRSGVIIALNNADGVGHVLLSQNSFGSNTYIDANNWSEFTDLNTTDDDKIYGRFTVPIVGWSAQDSNFLAALPMTKWQKKELSSSYYGSSGDAWISSMQFSNLNKNKTYKLTAHAFLGASGSSTGCNVTPYNGGTAAGDKIQDGLSLIIYESPSSDSQNELVSMTIIFSPKSDGDGTLRFYAELGSATDFVGGSGRTFATLEELPMHEEVDIW